MSACPIASFASPPARIGVWNTAFLGDAVLTLPLIQSLALAFPAASIDFYVRGGLASLFTGHPALRHVIAYDKRGSARGGAGAVAMCRQVAAQQYDLWVSPHTSLRSSAVAFASRAPVRVGYEEAVLSRLCYTHRVGRGFGQKHEVERLLALLEPLGVPPASVWPELPIASAARAEAEAWFATVPGPVLGMHPGSTWPTKCWPVEYFAELACTALEAGASVVLFAGKDEIDKTDAIEAAVHQRMGEAAGRCFNLGGKLGLGVLGAYIGRVSAYVTNDSGPMHLAWPQRVPVVALFGPTDASLGFAPKGESAVVMGVELPCRPCGLHGAKVCPQGHHGCMRQLSPGLVWESVQGMLFAGEK